MNHNPNLSLDSPDGRGGGPSSSFSFSGIKEALLAGGMEEVVQVNQRHLIDKILARYSGEHTVYRELIQNANDASATKVEINFITGMESSSKCVRVVVRNNGKH